MTAREKRRRARARMRRLRACPAFRACEAAIAAKRRDDDYRFREKLSRIRREARAEERAAA